MKPKDRYEDERGYQFIRSLGHPLLSPGQYCVAEHRLVLFDAIGPGPMDCELCGKHLTWKTCRVDHIDENPRNNARDNLRPTCNPCNARRGQRSPHEWDNTVSLTFDGVTKTAHEWSKDDRVQVTGSTIRRRKKAGMTDFEALFTEKTTHNGKPCKKTDERRAIKAEYKAKLKEFQ